MIRPGMPITVQQGGTSLTTTEFAPTRTLLPSLIGPSIFAPAPTKTLSPKAETMASILIGQGGGGLEVKANEYKAHLDGLVYGAKQDHRHLKIYVAKDGDTPATVARDVLGNQQLAWEVANLNGVKETAIFHAGDQVKLLPPVS